LDRENPKKIDAILAKSKITLVALRHLHDERLAILNDHEANFGPGSSIAKSLAALQQAQTRLSNLELSKTYLEALLNLDSLSFDIHTHVTGINVRKALATYEKLFDEWVKVARTTNVSGQDVAPKMRAYMTNVLVGAYENLKSRLVKYVLC